MKISPNAPAAAGNALVEKTISILETLRARRPLVHCLTNGVVKDITANLLLAVGASPAMVEDAAECEEFAGVAGALLVNVGTLDEEQKKIICAAIPAYVRAGKPWVLDPTAVGALTMRTVFARGLLQYRPALIRGNASEIIALAGGVSQGRGADSGDSSEAALEAACALAMRTGATVLVTGEIDYVTDGVRTATCANGHAVMTRVTGAGCAQGALAAACMASAGDAFSAGVATAAIMAIAGEIAAGYAPRPGSFRAAFIDEIDRIDAGIIREKARLAELPWQRNRSGCA